MFKTRKIIDKTISLDEMKRVVTRADRDKFANGVHPGTDKEDRFLRDNENRERYLKILFQLVINNKYVIFGKYDDPRLGSIWRSSSSRIVVDGYGCLSYFKFGTIKVKPDELFSLLKSRKDAIAGLPEHKAVYVTREDHTELTYADWDRIVEYLTEVKGYCSIRKTGDRRGVEYTDPEATGAGRHRITLRKLGEELKCFRQ